MNSRKRTWLIAIGGFIGGCAVGLSVAGYVGFQFLEQYVEDQLEANMQATAARAQTELSQLRALRAGEVDEVVFRLERSVDSRALALTDYERFQTASMSNLFIRRMLREIGAHRFEYPMTVENPLIRQRLEDAFASGAEVGTTQDQ